MLAYRLFIVLLLALYSLTVRCQQACDYLFTYHSDSVQKWQNLLRQRHITETQAFKGDFADQKKVLYQEKLKIIATHFEHAELVTDPATNNYIHLLMGKLQPAVSRLSPPGVNVFISRTGSPNAFTPGYHTIFLNAGLLTGIDNEAQLAFVLCHEMAHIFLKHNELAADQYLASIQSKAFRDEVAAIKKQDYGRGRAVEELSKKISFDSRRHSRFKETAADSLALEWLQQTGYDTDQAVTCLGILDSIDTDLCDTKRVFEIYLNFAEYPVRPSYFGTARRSVFGAAAFEADEQGLRMKDSLQTHPDCKQRMLYAEKMIRGANVKRGSLFLVDSVRFYQLQNQLRREQVDFALSDEKTSLGLFYALRQLNETGMNAFIAYSISKSLNQLYEAQKNHVLGRMVDLPNPQLYSKPYNELLHFIQNASLKDLANINYLFTNEAVKKFPDCKQLANMLAVCAANLGKTEEAAYWKKNAEQH